MTRFIWDGGTNGSRGAEYDAFIDRFVNAVKKCWPHVLLQFEDFAKGNAARLLEKYRDQLCTFNDDIQGTGAVAAAGVMAAVRAIGGKMKDQTGGDFGCGVRRHGHWGPDRHGHETGRHGFGFRSL
jgi:malic enzyme